MHTPLPHHLPAQSGASIAGQIITQDDYDRIVWRRIVRPMHVSLPAHLPAVIGHSRRLH